MKTITKPIKSVRGKLFITLCVVVLSIILFLIIVNSVVLEKYYQYTKSNQLKQLFETINLYYNGEIVIDDIEDEKDMVIPDDERVLGDIYISIDKARSQAKEYGHSLLRALSGAVSGCVCFGERAAGCGHAVLEWPRILFACTQSA